MKNLLISSIVLFILGTSACQRMDKPPQRPNVLFILADDLGNHDLSSTGSEYYETPNIDKIANAGMVFTQGYAACQVCSPSRASIMSGKFPARHGITDWIGAATGEAWRERGRHNKLLPPEYVHNLPKEYVTLPEALKAAGYKTFFAGKWHLGAKGSWPEDHGFDINKGGWDVGSPRGGFYAPWENPNLGDGAPGESLTMRLAEETAQFIGSHKDSAFFAFLSFYAVHAPVQTTREKWARYRDKAARQGIAETGFEMGYFLPIRQVQDHPVYAGLVETMDDAVGLVLDAIDEHGLRDNTIVIFTSDNGGVAAGDAYATSNLPLRAGKGYQYEGGVREPYFIRVPWLEHRGTRNETPVTGTDFYPTILELAGLDQLPHEHSDGVSLVPLLHGDSIAERPLVWHYPHYGNQGGRPSSMIRQGPWKLIHYYEDGSEVLYHLERDPGEQHDVSQQHPDIVRQLSGKMFAFLEDVQARYPEPDPQYSEALENQHLERVRNELMPRLEEQRRKFLSEDFDPGNQWWGSSVQDR